MPIQRKSSKRKIQKIVVMKRTDALPAPSVETPYDQEM